MKIIKHSDIEKLSFSPLEFMKWVEEALKIQYTTSLPPKISIPLEESGFFNTMPCHIPSHNVMGVKVVNRYKENNPAIDATMMLYNSVSGQLLTIMDATLITSMRTGAVAATSILKLKSSSKVNEMSIIGLGVTARAALLCLLETAPNEIFNIKLKRYKNQAESYIERFKDYNNVNFEIVDNNKDLIENADIILSCLTVAPELLGEDTWFKKGVLVVPVHTRGFQNCDLFFDKVYGDSTAQVSQFKYFDKFKYFNEFAKVIQGEDKGRENKEERILVYNIGIALHDIFIGNMIYNKLHQSDSSSSTVDFKEIIQKFYI